VKNEETNTFIILHTLDGRGFTYTFERKIAGNMKLWLPLSFRLPSPRTTIVGTRGTNWAYVNSLSVAGVQKIFAHGNALPFVALTGLCLQGFSEDEVVIQLQTGSQVL
jgi:hypothetical protein